MVTWQQRSVTWWQDMGAGVVTAAAALAASLLYLLVAMVVPLRLSPDAQYWVGHAPQFAFVAGFVLGTIVWRRVISRVSTPEKGAFVGSAMALGIWHSSQYWQECTYYCFHSSSVSLPGRGYTTQYSSIRNRCGLLSMLLEPSLLRGVRWLVPCSFPSERSQGGPPSVAVGSVGTNCLGS